MTDQVSMQYLPLEVYADEWFIIEIMSDPTGEYCFLAGGPFPTRVDALSSLGENTTNHEPTGVHIHYGNVTIH